MMMSKKKVFLAFIVGICCKLLHKIRQVEINPRDFSVKQRRIIDAEPEQLFEFLIHTHILEKLLPWMTRLKEADAKILTVGKFYRAFIKLPFLRKKQILFMVTDYKLSKRIALTTVDKYFTLNAKFRVKLHNNKTMLHATMHFARKDAIFHYTLGAILQHFINIHLKRSMQIVNEIYNTISKLEIR